MLVVCCVCVCILGRWFVACCELPLLFVCLCFECVVFVLAGCCPVLFRPGVDCRVVVFVSLAVDAVESWDVVSLAGFVCCCADFGSPVGVACVDGSDEVVLCLLVLGLVVDWSWGVAAFVGVSGVGGGHQCVRVCWWWGVSCDEGGGVVGVGGDVLGASCALLGPVGYMGVVHCVSPSCLFVRCLVVSRVQS